MIDEKLLSQIHNDAFLRGSVGLEGNYFKVTVDYLNQYIATLKEGIVSDSIKNLQFACDKMVEYDISISLPNSDNVASRIIKDLEKVKSNSERPYLLLPGGFSSSVVPGHAMVYEFKYAPSGDLLFCIHNSGSGLRYHKKTSSKEKELYNPVLTYTIPKQAASDPTFVEFIEFLLEPIQVNAELTSEKRNVDYLYTEVFPKLHFWGGKITNEYDSAQVKQFTAGQISGTCAQRSLHQMLKSNFDSIDEYRKFIYGFKAYSLDDYFKSIESQGEENLGSRQVQSELKKAIRHTLRLLNLKKIDKPDEALFDEAQKKCDLEKLTGYLRTLKRLRKPQTPFVKEIAEPPIEPVKIPDFRQIPTTHNVVGLRKERILPLPNNLTVIDQMKWIKQNSSEDSTATIGMLEKFFLQLPLPEQFKDPLPKNISDVLNHPANAIEFYELLNHLKSKYFNLLADSEKNLPRTYLIKLSLRSFLDHLNLHSPCGEHLPEKMINYSQEITKRYGSSVLLAMNDAEMDKRLQQIKQIASTYDYSKHTRNSRIEYYQKLLEKFGPGLIEEFNAKYETLVKSNPNFSPPVLHETLLAYRKDYRALYYFFTIEMSKNHPQVSSRYKKLYNIFLLHLKKEEMYTDNIGKNISLNPITNMIDYYKFKKSPYTETVHLDFYKVTEEFTPNKIVGKYESVMSGYSTRDNRIHTALMAESASSDNQIQFRTSLEYREWALLRKSPENQILLTLDYFNLHVDKLGYASDQEYFEANLFQPNLLSQHLTPDRQAYFFDKFDAVIKNGLKFYSKNGELSLESLFFIRMAYMVNAYAAGLTPQLFGDRLRNFVQQVNGLIEVTTDQTILASLYPYPVLAGSTGLLDMDQTEVFQSSVLAYLKGNTLLTTSEELDCDTRFRRKILRRNFEERLYEDQDLVTPEMVLSLLRSLHSGIDTENMHVTGNFPVYEINSTNKERLYTMDLAGGLLFDKTGKALTQPPEAILTHPIWKLMGLTPPNQCFISQNQNIVEYEQEGVHIRFIKSFKQSYDIQINWNNEGWHQLCAFSREQAEYLKIIPADAADAKNEIKNKFTSFKNPEFYPLSIPLPEILKEREILAWLSADKGSIKLTTHEGQLAYYMQCDTENHYITNVVGEEHTVLCEKNHDITRKISAIEDSKFITVFAKSDFTTKITGPFTVNLPRYGLTFTQDSIEAPLQFRHNHQVYELDSKPPFLGNGIAKAVFKSGTDSICILPIQRFISTGTRAQDSEYYQLTQDTSAVIRSVEERGKEPFQYSHTERSIILKMRDGKPVPESSAQALYLTYLYLGSNQPKKAWDMLDYCQKQFGGLKGDKDESLYLDWIMKQLPYHDESGEKEINDGANAVISNPKFVAVKLKAISLYTDYFRNNETGDSQEASKHNKDIYKYYTQLQKIRRDLPIHYQLSEEETYSLLNNYYKYSFNHATGALGYEWVQLHFKVLKKEFDILVIKESHTPLTAYEQERKNEIKHFVEQHKSVAKQQSLLTYIPIDVTIKKLSNYSFKLLRDEITQAMISHKVAPEVSLSLRFDVLKENFATYFAIAMSKKPKGDYEKLKKYCQTILIVSRDNSSDLFQKNELKQKRELATILYRVCCAEIKELPKTAKDLYGIIQYLEEFRSEPILIPEYRDTTNEIMIGSEVIWQNLPNPAASVKPDILNNNIAIKSFLNRLPALQLPVDQWLKLEKNFSNVESGEGEQLKTQLQIGKIKYEAKQQLKDLAKNTFFTTETQTQLHGAIETMQSEIRASQALLVDSILNLGNQDLLDSELQTEWDIDRASKKQKPLDLNALLTLYFNQDLLQYQQKTGLSAIKAQQLHQQLSIYVANKLQLQQCNRVLQCLSQVTAAKTDSIKEQAALLLAQTLLAENHADVLDEPVLSLFQLRSNILLRLDQKEAIQRLLRTTDGKYIETVEKIIMGAGKTKVLLPTLAQKKASGSNLVIIEVPESLLDTNYADLRSSSERFFQQKALLFQFNRDTLCSAEHLQEIFEKFTQVIVDKGYLVTTRKALQELELKYLELLHTPPKDRTEQWAKQILGADKLVSVLRNQGDLLIDEVHQGLWIKNKLNYTIGASIDPKNHVLKDCIALFKFLKHVHYDQQGLTLENILKKNQLLTKPEQFEEACNKLADALVENTNSPVYSLIQEAKAHYPDIENALKAYLKSQGTCIPQYLLEKDTSDEVKTIFSLYKEQVTRFLPYTLKRKHGEHYGPSLSDERSPESKAVSIPYLSNNTPSEKSRFGNYLEETNYTIQSMMISGLSRDLFTVYIQALLTGAKKELVYNQCASLDQTQLALEFQSLLEQYQIKKKLSEVDVTNQELMQLMYQKLANDPVVIFQTLEKNVLKNIKIETSVLHSDAINHVDQVRTCQAIDGTPNNHTTYNPRLSFETESAKGLDEYVAWAIRAKQPVIFGLEFQSTETFVEQLLTPPRCTQNLRALIDISATFKGQEALKVVEFIGKTLKANASPIKYILFFNTDNVLCAYDLRHTSKRVLVEIGSSDPKIIRHALNCSPDECFTYYDQSHCVGSDIRQSDDAEALVLIDSDTQKQHFLQGCTRMRKLLEGNQRINLIVPPSIAGENFDSLLEIMTKNEETQLKNENYQAVLSKMDGVIRNDLMKRILAVDVKGENAAQLKAQLFEKWKNYFIEEKVTDIFKLYGGLSKVKNTSDILTEYQKSVFESWKNQVDKLSAEEIDKVQEELNKILSSALKENACFPTQICPAEELNTHIEVQHELQKEIQKEVQKEIQKENVKQNLTEEEYVPWPANALPVLQQASSLNFKTLTKICSGTPDANTPEFTPNIFATTNFYRTYTTQTHSLDSFSKPVHALLFTNDPLQCVILSQQELVDLSKNLPAKAWITTTQNTILAGTPPEGISLDKTYLSIIEQVQYFNGECSLLIENYKNLTWLRKNTESKLCFLKETLSKMHDVNLSEIEYLKRIMEHPIERDTPSLLRNITPKPPKTPVPNNGDENTVLELRKSCEMYMRYALKEMKIPYNETGAYPRNLPILTKNKKINLLAKKYHYMHELFDITQAPKSPTKVLKLFKARLNSGDFDLLKKHRDSLFVRILSRMRDIFCSKTPINQFFKLDRPESERFGDKLKQIISKP